jgi:hypothetical protein
MVQARVPLLRAQAGMHVEQLHHLSGGAELHHHHLTPEQLAEHSAAVQQQLAAQGHAEAADAAAQYVQQARCPPCAVA